MMGSSIKKSSVLIFLFSLVILTAPLNFGYYDFKIHDAFFGCAFIFTVFFASYPVWALFFLLFLVLMMASFLVGNGDHFLLFAFLYKYLFVFLQFVLPFVIIRYVSHPNQLKALLFSGFLSFLFLVIWVYFYFGLLSAGLIDGYYRPSMPSLNFKKSDAHLYSYVLGFLLVWFNALIGLRIFSFKIFWIWAINILSIISLIILASRTGIFLVAVSSFLYVVWFTVGVLSHGKLSCRVIFGGFSFFVSLLLLIYFYGDIFYFYFSDYINRIFSLGLAADASSQARLDNIASAINTPSSTFYLLGVDSAREIWFDNFWVHVFLYTGALGVFSLIFFGFCVLFFLFKSNARKKVKVFFFILFFYIFLATFITEYILVSRGAILTIFLGVFSFLYVLKVDGSCYQMSTRKPVINRRS